MCSPFHASDLFRGSSVSDFMFYFNDKILMILFSYDKILALALRW